MKNQSFLKSQKQYSTNKFSRRSFLSKSAFSSLGIFILPGFNHPVYQPHPINKTKEEIYKQIDELVDKYFPVYGTCSQTTFHVLNEIFELKSENITKALASFPGVAMRGETCGAVTASLLAIGLVYEEDLAESKNKRLSFGPSVKFCSDFEKEFGTTRCQDVIEHVSGKKYTITKPEDYGQLAQEGVLNHCPAVVKKAIKTAADIILGKA